MLGDDCQAVSDPVLKLFKQHILLAQQFLVMARQIALPGYILKLSRIVSCAPFIENLAGIQEHRAPPDTRKLMLDLEIVDRDVLRQDVAEQCVKRRDVPCPIPQIVKVLAESVGGRCGEQR